MNPLPSDPELAALMRRLLPHAQAAWLFGSAAEGRMRTASDVDIAVWHPSPLTGPARFEAACAAASALGRDVDLLDLLRLPAAMQAHVLQSGRLLFAESPLQLLHLKARVMRDYQDMQAWHAPMVAALADRLRQKVAA